MCMNRKERRRIGALRLHFAAIWTAGGAAFGPATAGPPPNDDCANAMRVFDGENSFTTIGATTDGRAHASCLFCCDDDQINQDVWFSYTATASGEFNAWLCNGTSYDSKLAIYEGTGCPTEDPIACSDDSCLLVSKISGIQVSAGNSYTIRVGGYGAKAGPGILTLFYGDPPSPCGPPNHRCCSPGGPGCNDVKCCEAVCAADPFCCDIAWDVLCVAAADSLCGPVCVDGCSPDNPHDCFTVGGPGCNDVECCETVGCIDPHCYQTAWDADCVALAEQLCGKRCELACPPDAILEPESCGEMINDGCESAAPIDCRDVICGTFWANGAAQDLDYFQFTVLETSQVSFSVEAQFPVDLSIFNNNCATMITQAKGIGVCPAVASAVLEPAVYLAIVRPISINCLPCGGDKNDYIATLSCTSPCAADPNEDGMVDVDDLLMIINSWGPCPDCAADINGSNAVDVDDLLAVINGWGPCDG